MKLNRGLLAIVVSVLAHLGLVPLLAIYGVQICPVLSDKGFSFGCRYNLGFVLCSLALSAIANSILFFVLKARTHVNAAHWTLRDFGWISSALHFLVFTINIMILRSYLISLDLPGPTLIRMSAAFAIAAILLSILQGEAFDWATQGWLRTADQWRGLDSSTSASPSKTGLVRRWLVSEVSRATPYWACLGVVLVYAFSKILEYQELYGVDQDYLESRTSEAWQILGLAVGWLILVEFIKLRKDGELLSDLATHVEEIGNGKTDHISREVASGIWREIFQILNRMNKAMAQRSRLIKGLSAYATEQVVEKVINKDELQTFGSRQGMAILMSDLRSFTEMSNRLSPEVVVQVLNIYFESMIEVCVRHDLVVDKFIGDGLLAYADNRIGTEGDQCERTILSAFAMLKALDEINLRLKTMGLMDLSIRVGLHFGDVIVGSIGSKDRLQHTIIGDAVNTASRLEAECKELGVSVVASRAIVETAGLTRSSGLHHHGLVSIRGLTKEVDVFTSDLSLAQPASKRTA